MQTQLKVQTLAKEASRAMNGLTFPQVRAMAFLKLRGPAALRDVADYQGLTPSAISQVIDALVDRGLVRRREDPDDRRRVLLDLTPAGRQATEAAQRAFVGVIARAFRGISDKDRDHLERGLRAMLAAYDADPGFQR